MSMGRKQYQALAGAVHSARVDEDYTSTRRLLDELARVLVDDNPRFDRETFIAACEDGNVTRRPKRTRTVTELIHGRGHVSGSERRPKRNGHIPPRCAVAMGCLCAGHARGNPASEPCDTREN